MHPQRLKQLKLTIMEAVKQSTCDVDVNVTRTLIREAYLIDPNWREQPMRAWDDVYEDLCREVGCAYGLNDIREA